MEARSQTAPQAHTLQGATSLFSPLRGFSSNAAVEYPEQAVFMAVLNAAELSTEGIFRTYGRDREHFGGDVVSKKIGRVGHRAQKCR